MPGLSSRNPVAGYGNIGKVQIRFKPKPQKKPLYGAILFLFCACLLLFSWSWTDPWKRNTIILPTMRSILRHIDTYRIQMTNKSSDNKTNQFKIDFDDLGRAIISGDSIQKVLFGQGYEHAKNRIFQMDLNRHKAYGSLSSWQGERALSTDMMARVMNISSLARSDFAAHNDIEREYLQSYCDGVNSFIQEGNALPVEYKLLGLNEIEPWTPLDSLVLLRYHSTLSSEIWEVELTQYMVSQEPKSTNFTSAFAFPRHENGIDKTSATVIPSVSSSTAWVMQPIASMSPSTASAPLPLHSTRIVTEVSASCYPCLIPMQCDVIVQLDMTVLANSLLTKHFCCSPTPQACISTIPYMYQTNCMLPERLFQACPSFGWVETIIFPGHSRRHRLTLRICFKNPFRNM